MVLEGFFSPLGSPSFVEIMTGSFRKQIVDFLSSAGEQGVKYHFAFEKLGPHTGSVSEAGFIGSCSKLFEAEFHLQSILSSHVALGQSSAELDYTSSVLIC